MKRVWFLYDLNKDGALDPSDWEYLFARDNTTNGSYAIKLGGRGDVTKTQMLWRHEKGLTSFNPTNGSVLKQGRVEEQWILILLRRCLPTAS